jgi:hypothetical protein
MRKCRKCKSNFVSEYRKYCDQCKLQNKTCQCGILFRSNKWDFCIKCRGSQGQIGNCYGCEKSKKLYWSTGLCQGCYKCIIKYKLNKETIKELNLITNCEICGIKLHHKEGNSNNRAVIDHDHNTGKVRGVLCSQCNIIEGMIRDEEHLERFYTNYKKWLLK